MNYEKSKNGEALFSGETTMKLSARIAGLGSVGLALLLWGSARARALEPDDAPPDGIEVQAKGPVHEAFAQPNEKDPKATPVLAKKPPAPVVEEPPDRKPEGANVQWIPGYWAWDGDKKDY